MQYANVLVALGGDSTNKVWKPGVSVPEVQVLQAIHGSDAVSEIDILPALGKRDPYTGARDERDRLLKLYPGRDGNGVAHFDRLYPAGARLPTSFRDLDLDETLYKAEKRRTPDEVDAEEGKTVLAMEPREAFAAEAKTGLKAEDHDDYVEAERTGDYEVERDAADPADLALAGLTKAEQKDLAVASVEANKAVPANVPQPQIVESGEPSKRAPRLGGRAAATKAEKENADKQPAPAKSILD